MVRRSIITIISELLRELELREVYEEGLTNEDIMSLATARYHLAVASRHAAISRCARRGRTFERMLICGNHWATADDHVDAAEEHLRPFRLR